MEDLHVENDWSREPLPKRLSHVLPRLKDDSIRTPGTNEEKTVEGVELVGVSIGNVLLFRGVLVEPKVERALN